MCQLKLDNWKGREKKLMLYDYFFEKNLRVEAKVKLIFRKRVLKF